MERLIYLDHAATTPLHPGALEAMLPFLTGSYGNPSATYGLAKQAGDAVQRARRSVAIASNLFVQDSIAHSTICMVIESACN